MTKATVTAQIIVEDLLVVDEQYYRFTGNSFLNQSRCLLGPEGVLPINHELPGMSLFPVDYMSIETEYPNFNIGPKK